jgi:hypothetical protein
MKLSEWRINIEDCSDMCLIEIQTLTRECCIMDMVGNILTINLINIKKSLKKLSLKQKMLGDDYGTMMPVVEKEKRQK